MPLYEFDCRKCGSRFETLVRGAETPQCPSCQSPDLQRVHSLFGVSSEGTRRANLEAGRKHRAKDVRDKQVADHEAAHHHHH